MRKLAPLLPAAILLASASCAASAREPERATAGGYRLLRAPAAMAEECRRAQVHVRFAVLCPTMVPRARDGSRPDVFARRDGDRLYVGVAYGIEADPRNWRWNNPDLFLHFVVYEGRLTPRLLELDGEWPQRRLGARSLGGRRGILYEQVSYAVCGCGLGGHVTFVWHDRGIDYAASLHRWSRRTNRESVALLDELVAALQDVERH